MKRSTVLPLTRHVPSRHEFFYVGEIHYSNSLRPALARQLSIRPPTRRRFVLGLAVDVAYVGTDPPFGRALLTHFLPLPTEFNLAS
jgi:hypothetical protein